MADTNDLNPYAAPSAPMGDEPKTLRSPRSKWVYFFVLRCFVVFLFSPFVVFLDQHGYAKYGGVVIEFMFEPVVVLVFLLTNCGSMVMLIQSFRKRNPSKLLVICDLMLYPVQFYFLVAFAQ